MNRNIIIAVAALQLVSLSACGEKKDEAAERIAHKEKTLAERKALAERIRENSIKARMKAPVVARKGESQRDVERRALMTMRARAMGRNEIRVRFPADGRGPNDTRPRSE